MSEHIVILDKGLKGQKTWTHTSEASAMVRINALSDLHGDCEYTKEGNTITVHGAKWYKINRK